MLAAVAALVAVGAVVAVVAVVAVEAVAAVVEAAISSTKAVPCHMNFSDEQPRPGPQEYVKQKSFGLFLGHSLTYSCSTGKHSRPVR